MATLNVTTWAQLVNAIETSLDGDVIQLKADIDCDNEIPEGSSMINISADTKSITISGAKPPAFRENYYYEKTLVSGVYVYTVLLSEPADWETNFTDYYYVKTVHEQGELYQIYLTVLPKSYKIKNLRNAANNSSAIIYAGGPLDFEYIDFQNLILSGADFVSLVENYSSIRCVGCRFTGSRSGEAFLFDVAHSQNIALVSCAFDIPWQGMGAASSDAALAWTALAPKFSYSETWTGSFTADYCRFHEHYTGWQIPTYQGSSPSKSQYVLSCAPFIINGCYIYGDMTCSMTYQSSGNFLTLRMNAQICPSSVNAKNPQTAQNVVDVEFRGTSSSTTTPEEKSFNTAILTGNLFGIIRNTCYCNSVGHPEYIRAQTTEMQAGFTASGKAIAAYVDDETFASDLDLFKKGFDIVIQEGE
jgi:hypothetical protein